MLKLIVDALDTVAEEHRGLYVQEGEKFRLQLDGYEDPAGLKSALDKERKAARDAEKAAKSWAALGKTPEEISELLEAQRKAEEDKATKNGEWDKLKAQMLEKHQAELAKSDDATKVMRSQLERHLVDAAATTAIVGAKGSPALLLPHVKASLRVVEEDGEFIARVVDKAGNPRVNGKGDFLSIADLVGEMRQSDEFGRAFDPTGTSGGGAGGGGSGAHGKPAIKDLSQAKTREERIAVLNARIAAADS